MRKSRTLGSVRGALSNGRPYRDPPGQGNCRQPGHRRYAHITALRGDAVAAQALGMNKVVSEDALRRALERIDEAASTAWMRPALMHSVREALDKSWVLDIDATIKPLYGRQEGANQILHVRICAGGGG